MNPAEFLERWRHAGAAERANKDSFLAELCDVLGVERPLPKTNDPEKDRYVFEKDVARSREDRTSIGRIDLFRAGCFVLEAKQVDSARRGTPAWEQAMNDAHGQALGYARSLPVAPPFVVVCDIGHCFDLYASFDGSGAYRPFPDAFRKRLFLADLERHLPLLRALWDDPLGLDPARQQSKITREVAAKLANKLVGNKKQIEKLRRRLSRSLRGSWAFFWRISPNAQISRITAAVGFGRRDSSAEKSPIPADSCCAGSM